MNCSNSGPQHSVPASNQSLRSELTLHLVPTLRVRNLRLFIAFETQLTVLPENRVYPSSDNLYLP